MKLQRIYLAGACKQMGLKEREWMIEYLQKKRMMTLESFWYKGGMTRSFSKWEGFKVFLDSGAYSWDQFITKRGETVTEEKEMEYLDTYITFIKEHRDRLYGYANLDFVGNPEKTLRTQRYMEAAGVTPVPVFHYHPELGNPERKKYHFGFLREMLQEYDYIALGGGVSGGLNSHKYITRFGDEVFRIIDGLDKETMVHGFGITSVPLMFRYPWFSVDSTTWLQVAAYGKIFVPKYNFVTGQLRYDLPPNPIGVSWESKINPKSVVHFTLERTAKEQKVLLNYLEEIGIDVDLLERSYSERARANVIYFENLLKYIEEEKINTGKRIPKPFF